MPRTASDLLSLPYLQGGQAQKHITHNAALERLDLLVQTTLEATGATLPPAAPEAGAAYALGSAPGGDWAGQGGDIAFFAGGGWLFVAPREGWRAWNRETGALTVFTGGVWATIGGGDGTAPIDTQNTDGLGINTGWDTGNRLAVSSPATLFTHDGTDHRLSVNKASAADTASLLFQTDFSGRAEMGLAGNDDFEIKTSPDGTTWTTALSIAAATGAVSLPATPARVLLDAPRDWHVDPAGDDADDGLSPGTAFATLARALEAARTVDAGGHALRILMATGVHTVPFALSIGPDFVGTGGIEILGDPANPASVTLEAAGSLFDLWATGLSLRGLTCRTISSSARLISARLGARLDLGDLRFGAGGFAHVLAQAASVTVVGDIEITGGAGYHVLLQSNSAYQCKSVALTLTGTPGFPTSFFSATENSTASFYNAPITGAATGRRYIAGTGALVNTRTNDPDYFPGDVAGLAQQGGLYF